MKRILTAAFVLLFASVARAAGETDTELGRLAAAMKPGTWAELKTMGYGPELLQVQTHHILEYTDTAVWEPKFRQVLFVGQGHYSALRFIAYSAATNTWTQLPLPSWWKGDAATGKGPIGHAYNNNAIDPARGLLFLHQSATPLVHRFDVAKGEWTTLPPIKGAQTGHGTAIVWFPEMKALVRVLAGSVHVFDEARNNWVLLKDKVPMGPYHNIAKYNPADKSVIFGAGNGSRVLHRLDASGAITPLPEAPFVIRISSTTVTVDPVRGDVLVINGEKKNNFHALDLKKNEWRQLPDSPINDGAAAMIPQLGGNLFFTNRPARVFLYKHGP